MFYTFYDIIETLIKKNVTYIIHWEVFMNY